MTKVERLKLLASAIAGDFKSLRLKLGNTDELVTDDKTSAVKAINEVASSSKEIKDSIEKFKAEIDINPEIAAANNISVNPFELLVPFIKNQISNGQTFDNEYNETIYYIPSQPHVIKSILNVKLSSNVGFKIKQGTFEKFVHFTSPIEDNFELPAEIDTSKEYTINEYDVFGHYLKTYKVLPYIDFIRNHITDLTNSLTNFDTGYSFKGGKTITIVYDNNEQEKLLKKIEYPQEYTYLYINKNNQYLDLGTNSWKNLSEISNINISDEYQQEVVKNIKKMYSNEFSFNNVIFLNQNNIDYKLTTTSDFMIIVLSKELENTYSIKNFLLESEYPTNCVFVDEAFTKFYNPILQQWIVMPANIFDNYNNKMIDNLVNAEYYPIRNLFRDDHHLNLSSAKIYFLNDEDKTFVNVKDIFEYLRSNFDRITIINKDITKFYNPFTRTWETITEENKNKILANPNSQIKAYWENQDYVKNIELVKKYLEDKLDDIDLTSIANIINETRDVNLVAVNNQIGTKEVVQNQTYVPLSKKAEINLTHTKIYTAGYNTSPDETFETYDITKIPVLKILNIPQNLISNNVAQDMTNGGILVIDCMYTDYHNKYTKQIDVFYNGKYYKILDGKFFDKIKDVLYFHTDTKTATPDYL
jgi:hypothetical protein